VSVLSVEKGVEECVVCVLVLIPLPWFSDSVAFLVVYFYSFLYRSRGYGYRGILQRCQSQSRINRLLGAIPWVPGTESQLPSPSANAITHRHKRSSTG
jgi:hypothetical protein